tara:strand:+ start:950 stop:2476 length:1527 start_codon:yes stop_codon:yes gene_type:complete
MAYDDDDKKKPLFIGERLTSGVQDPAPVVPKGTTAIERMNQIEDAIMVQLFNRLPSNYVSKAQGPIYTNVFRSVAKQLAEYQVEAELASDDPRYDLTRSEFLYQILGQVVFPEAMRPRAELVDVDGDVPLRDFLREMVVLLIEGSRKDPVEKGVGLLSDIGVDIVESVAFEGKPGSGVGLEDQFEIEVNAVSPKHTVKDQHQHWHRIRVNSEGNGKTHGTYSSDGSEDYHSHEIKNFEVQPYVASDLSEHTHDFEQAFPDNPFILQHNIKLILKALKPAHLLYQYRHFFVEFYGEVFKDDPTWEYFTWKYEDLRKNWRGAKEITGSARTGEGNKAFLVDPKRDFLNVLPGSPVEITDGQNISSYQVKEVHRLPFPTDLVPRSYETSPSGLVGSAYVKDGVIYDKTLNPFGDPAPVNLGAVAEDEVFTFTEGPNLGSYRIEMVLGPDGGLPGKGLWSSTEVLIAHSILEVRPPMPYRVDSQTYSVGVDRLGSSTPKKVQSETVSEQFYL